MIGDFNMDIIKIDQALNVNADVFGNKAAALAHIGNNLNVPEGYIISKKIYDSLLSSNNLCIPDITSAYMFGGIRDSIISSVFTPQILFELESIYKQLIGEKDDEKITLAVRSSALSEDLPDSSKAGMFDSFLRIDSFDEMVSAIKKCYSSLYSDQCLEQILAGYTNKDTLSMGIIIQQYLPGEISGVMFTSDTIQMDDQIICINYAKGTCDQFISRGTESYMLRINKETGEKIDHNENEQSFILPQEILKQLYEAANICEDILGLRQDIEWTWFRGQLYILQSRNITTFKICKPDSYWRIDRKDQNTWHLVANNPYKPLMIDIENLELNLGNFGAYTAGYQHHYESIAFYNGYQYRTGKQISNRELKEKEFYAYLDHLDSIGKNLFYDIILPHYKILINRLEQYTTQDLTPIMLSEYLKDAIDYLKITSKTHWIAIHGRKFRRKFYEYCLNIIPDLDMSMFYDLVFAESSLHKKRAMILDIVKLIYNDENILTLIQECPYDRIVYQKINILSSQTAQDIIKKINEYCETYPVFGAGYDEILHKVLSEEKSNAIRDIRPYLAKENNSRFNNIIKQNKKNKDKLLKIISNKLNQSEYKVFLKKLDMAEKAYLTGEEHNFYIECQQRGYLRLALSQIVKYFKLKKWINSEDDIYFFHLDEIFNYLHDNILLIDIEKRKTEYKEKKQLLPPQTIYPFTPDEEHPEEIPFTQTVEINNEEPEEEKNELPVLQGISGFYGNAKGKVFFGLPREGVGNGEKRILVLYNGHAGDIVPHLNYTAGLLFEEGSPFDHIGIIARELGIPAVYYLKDSLGLLCMDDVIEIEGTTGKVRVVTRINNNGG